MRSQGLVADNDRAAVVGPQHRADKPRRCSGVSGYRRPRRASNNIAIGAASIDNVPGSGTAATSGVAWPSAMLQVIAIPIIEQKRSANVPLILRLNDFTISTPTDVGKHGQDKLFNHVLKFLA